MRERERETELKYLFERSTTLSKQGEKYISSSAVAHTQAEDVNYMEYINKFL